MQVGGVNRDSARYVELNELDIVCSLDELEVLAGFFDHVRGEMERLYGDSPCDGGAHFHLQQYWKGWRGADSDIVVILPGKEQV